MTPLICTPIVSQTVTEVARGKMNKIAAQHKLELGWWESKYKATEGNQSSELVSPVVFEWGLGGGRGEAGKDCFRSSFSGDTKSFSIYFIEI